MIQLLFCFCLVVGAVSKASTFEEKHIDPFLNRLTDQTSAVLFLTGTVSVLAVKPYDETIRDQNKNNQKMSEANSNFGDQLGTGVFGLVFVAGQYYFDLDTNHYQSLLRSLVYSTVTTSLMKVSFRRQRPGNSDSYHSFPSGHTAISFATATSLTYAYGWKAAVIAYPLAAFVGLSRLADDAHWGSDVVAGAFVGCIIARASSYSWSDENNQLIVYPDIGPEQFGLTVNYQY